MSFLNDRDSNAVALLARGKMVPDGAGASTRNMADPMGRRGQMMAPRGAGPRDGTGRRDGSGRGFGGLVRGPRRDGTGRRSGLFSRLAGAIQKGGS